ncbi:PREDICTED: uncharacterized protein LOC109580488 [Amphimedon queenslandica]|uniref:Uncharacterized protein n=1 Tax=Amphimedon queenslandica TaxID=400682 RepID=A0AAN0IWY7_AMPQE|nr:PREDICTED: uncharacterized protein LOC109580488 [Amphimedon queenslandica]|eukprot:XP_019849284.1 PREDICTED: uncharacterized protein LOC109580488 [Amphimedon queenslandica]
MFRGKRERDVEKKEKSSSSRKRTRFVTPINPSQSEGLSQEKELTSATLEHSAPSHTPTHEPLLLNDSLDVLVSPHNSSIDDSINEGQDSIDSSTVADTGRSYTPLKQNKKYDLHGFRNIQGKRGHRKESHKMNQSRSMNQSKSMEISLSRQLSSPRGDTTDVFDFPVSQEGHHGGSIYRDSEGDHNGSSSLNEEDQYMNESAELFTKSKINDEKRAINAQVLKTILKTKKDLQNMRERYAILFASEVTSKNQKDLSIFLTGSEE